MTVLPKTLSFAKTSFRIWFRFVFCCVCIYNLELFQSYRYLFHKLSTLGNEINNTFAYLIMHQNVKVNKKKSEMALLLIDDDTSFILCFWEYFFQHCIKFNQRNFKKCVLLNLNKISNETLRI